MSDGVLDKSVCLDVTFHKPGACRKGDMALIDTDAEKQRLGLSKRLLVSPEYQKLGQIAGEFRRWVETRAVPSPLKRGTYLIPLPLVEEVYVKADAAEAAYQAAGNAFLVVYPSEQAQAEHELGSQYDPRQWPDAERVRKAIYVERRLFDFAPPGQSKVSEYLWAKESARAEKELRAASQEVEAALREAFRKLVAHLAESLEPKPDGTRRRFHASAVEKLAEFLDLFQHRNLTDDEATAALVAHARQVLDGKSVEDIKGNAVVSGEVRTEMQKVCVALDGLLAAGPVRAISFEE